MLRLHSALLFYTLLARYDEVALVVSLLWICQPCPLIASPFAFSRTHTRRTRNAAGKEAIQDNIFDGRKHLHLNEASAFDVGALPR